MPNLYMPGEQALNYLTGLQQGFYLEIDGHDICVLIIKLEASILQSIISGCPLEIVIRNPYITKRSCTVYIYDTPQEPLFITGTQFGEEDEHVKGLDKVATHLALKSKIIRIALFNELNHQVYSTELKTDHNINDFHNWLYQVFNNPEYRELKNNKNELYHLENEKTGFAIKILNFDHSDEEKLLIAAPEYEDEWRQNPSSTFGSFNHEDYQGNGKHGYYQELSITNGLSRFFKPNVDLFISPKNADGTEFTDFALFNHNAVIIFESKYVISTKSSKRSNALTKAIDQLNKVESAILNKTFILENKEFADRLSAVNVVVKICILNDRIALTDGNTQNITAGYLKKKLPIFTSATRFFDFTTALSLKNPPLLSDNVFHNLITMYLEYLNNDEKFLELRYFTVEGLSVEELNQLNINRN